MNKVIFLIFFLTTIVNTFSQNSYSNEEFHYSFIVPKNWRQIPKYEIDDQMKKLSDLTGTKFVNFATGFQPDNLNLNQYPHLLIQNFKYPFSWQEFLKLYGNFYDHMDIDDGYKLFMSEFVTQKPIINEEKFMIVLNNETYVEGIGEIRATTVLILGQIGFTQFNITVLKKDYNKYLPDVTQIIDTLKFDENFTYNIKENTLNIVEQKSTEEIFRQAANAGKRGAISALGIFIFLIPIFIIYGVIKFIKKRGFKC